jgi:PAS domain S-box-containing protein
VRSSVLLLILCLVIMVVGATYLYASAKSRLAQELDEQLQRAGTLAIARLEAGGRRANALDLRSVLAETGISRLFLWEIAGGETIVGSGPSVRPPTGAVEEAWTGGARFTDFYGDRHQGFYRAMLVPVVPGPGETRRVLGVEARHDFLGALHRYRWVIIIGYSGGLALTLVLGVLSIRSILRPYSRLTSVARDFRKAEGDVARESPESIDLVVSTFQRAMETLREKEVELSRRYAAESTRAETLERYQQSILESLSSGVISFKPDLTIAVFNKSAARIFGIAGEEAVGRACHEVFGADSEITAVAGEALRRRRIFSRLELSVRRRDGAVRRAGLSSSLLKDSDGNLIGLALLLTDLTDILQFREQAMMRESLAALGEMSAGVAHELRNSLGVISGYTKLLQRGLPPDDPNQGYLQEIVSEIDLLEATARDFLAFARPVQLARVPVHVNAVVNETLDGFRKAIEEGHIKLVTDLPQQQVTVVGDSQALRQALGNLVRNALEAMPGGGELTVQVRQSDQGPPGARDPGPGTVEIAVSDTGPGIPPEDLKRIFTPFFTLKEGGTGLGLALVQKTILALGGRVDAENREGGGARFALRLPVNERRGVGRT